MATASRPFLWPWQQADPETGLPIAQYEEPAGPVQASGLFYSTDNAAGEFSFAKTLQESINKFAVNTNRITKKETDTANQQRPWYDLLGKAKDSVANGAMVANEALQSTLWKILLILVFGSLFYIYISTKVARAA